MISASAVYGTARITTSSRMGLPKEIAWVVAPLRATACNSAASDQAGADAAGHVARAKHRNVHRLPPQSCLLL